MANYISGQDLINAVLNIAGELTDGTSGYQQDAEDYLNLAYKGVLTGGNIYGIDVADPWPWALAPRPIVLTLQPVIQTVAVSTTQFSNNISFGTIPLDVIGNPISVQNWWININDRDEWFKIVQHTAGTTIAQIDVGYTEVGVLNSTCIICQLDYDLVDNSVLVTNYNQVVDFTETGAALVANLTVGIYAPQAFATMVAAAMTAASGATFTYTGSWNATTRLFTWSASGVFSILNATGAHVGVNSAANMGLDDLDYSGTASYAASYPLNAIQRLTAPMVCYKQNNYYPVQGWVSPKDDGKIFELSFNGFTRLFPLRYMVSQIPEKFCVTNTASNGIVSVRFSSYVYTNPTKVEVNYIPLQRDLQFNTASIPVVPEAHRKYLVDAAAAMLLHDKVDNRAAARTDIAKAGLQALLHSNRKDLSLAGNNYGKLVPRLGATSNRRWNIT